MGLQVNIKKAFGELALDAGKRLAVAAVTLVNNHQKRLSVGNPAPHDKPSKPGEYPRLVTGFGRAQATYLPQTVEEMAAKGHVDVGIGEAGFYLEVLAEKRGRLGMLDTFEETKAQTLAILNGGGNG